MAGRQTGCAMAGRQVGCGFYLQPSPDQWNALFMLALRYHLSGAISCCVLQNRANMNTMWHTINHMCQSGETQRILLCQQPGSLCLRGWGRQSSFITRTSWRLPVSRHHSDQCCRPELMFQDGNLKGEPQGSIYLLRLLHGSGHNSALTEVHKITPISFALLPWTQISHPFNWV